MPRRTPKAIRGPKPTHVRVRAEPIAQQVRDALDPEKASGKPRTWSDMTPEERAAITATYRRK
jgi:hypothetical protein